MPVQFPYPEQGWSAGTMRKAFSNEPWPPRKPPGPGDWRKALESMPPLPKPDQKLSKLPPRQGPTQQDWIGVEGERKRKETKVSQAEQLQEQRGSMPGALGKGEWNDWFRSLPSGYNFLGGSKGESIPDLLSQSPEGVTVPKNHPGVKDLGDEYDVKSVPEMGHDWLLVRPKVKPPLVS